MERSVHLDDVHLDDLHIDYASGGVGTCSDVDSLDRALVHLVRRMGDPRLTAFLNDCAEVDIERSGFVLMARIEEHDMARLGDIAAAADIDITSASRQVARLVAHGLVARRPDPDDRRAMHHHHTPDGVAALQRLRAARRAWLEDALRTFAPDERDQFTRLFDHFVGVLSRSF